MVYTHGVEPGTGVGFTTQKLGSVCEMMMFSPENQFADDHS
jgi:hypothetical protein